MTLEGSAPANPNCLGTAPIQDQLAAQEVVVTSTEYTCGCLECPACQLGLCVSNKTNVADTISHLTSAHLHSSLQTVKARRIICHPKEWSEFVTVICSGWAASSVVLADGRRQILSFLLSGDLVSTASIFGATSSRSVEAITDVTFRKFKRADFTTAMSNNPNFLEALSKAWITEREQADQLIVDLGRRMANERVARQILYLAEKLSRRGMMNGPTMHFPLRRRHIADATGLTSVHASKVLSDLQNSGLIAINNRMLTITNLAELRYAAHWH